MAIQYYGINRGQNEFDIVEGASTNSTDMEFALDLSKSLLKSEVLLALDKIANRILKDDFPPA